MRRIHTPRKVLWVTVVPTERETEKKLTTDDHSPRGSTCMTDAEAMELLNRLHAGDRRSSFAQALFPYDRTKYRSRGEWAKEVGSRVANDIRQHTQLRLSMEAAGYMPRKQGYTLEQRILLVKFYKGRLLVT